MSEKKQTELTNACRVTCETSDDVDGDRQWSVYLPERLLWSPEGLAALFHICRKWLANPDDHRESSGLLKIEDAWALFHIVSIEEVDGFVFDVEEAPERYAFDPEPEPQPAPEPP